MLLLFSEHHADGAVLALGSLYNTDLSTFMLLKVEIPNRPTVLNDKMCHRLNIDFFFNSSNRVVSVVSFI